MLVKTLLRGVFFVPLFVIGAALTFELISGQEAMSQAAQEEAAPQSTEEAQPSSKHIDVIKVSGAIGPVSLRQIATAISRAEGDSAECLVIMLDTPGGLLESTQMIIKEMLASNVPIVVYVAPSGAGAGSAGVFITMSAHVAAMAPGTSIGAAHPVGVGGAVADSTMAEKVENFSVSYIRSIAEKHGPRATFMRKPFSHLTIVVRERAKGA